MAKKNQALVTGGAGFIGCNAARRLLDLGWEVEIWDNLSRTGGVQNLDWIKEAGSFHFEKVDLRDSARVDQGLNNRRFDLILHCAGQVAVTTSVTNPREDFEINLLGTFNLLESVRIHCPETFLIYTSTNKVYGGMEEVGIVLRNGRYEYENLPNGVSERQSLDFHSPYGCSKGGADQYVRDYARIYGLHTTSFRQSCVYGRRQFGVEDQGWVAWFTIAHALDRQVTIYGDGCQTRDVLFIDDLVDAYLLAFEHRERTSGEVFNIGGGPTNLLSLLELLQLLKASTGRELRHAFADWRPGDQRTFVADIRKAMDFFRWSPKTSARAGVTLLADWVEENLSLFRTT